MKLSSAVLFLAAAAATSVAQAGVQVGLELECQGLDYHDMPPKALARTAKVLESSYNAVHNKVDGSSISEVFTTGPFAKASVLRGSGNENNPHAIAYFGSASAFDFGGDGCRKCRTDDELVAETETKAWEAMFNAMMAKEGHFGKSVTCTINNFKPISEASRFDFGGDGCSKCRNDDLLGEDVTLKVECENVDMSELSLRALNKVAKSLEETYNVVHEEGSLKSVALEGSHYQAGFDFGGDGCSKCRNDDLLDNYAVEFKAALVGGGFGGDGCTKCNNDDFASTEAWAALLRARLMKDADFKTVGACSIEAVEEEAVATH